MDNILEKKSGLYMGIYGRCPLCVVVCGLLFVCTPDLLCSGSTRKFREDRAPSSNFHCSLSRKPLEENVKRAGDKSYVFAEGDRSVPIENEGRCIL